MAQAVMPATAGPYQTAAQAAAEPMPQEVRQLMEAGGSMAIASSIRYVALVNTCVGAQVELGKFDALALTHLAGWDKETCQVIIGLITRAYAAGLRDGAA